MEIIVWVAVVGLGAWNFWLHGKVRENSIAAKTQQIIKEFVKGQKKSWEDDFKGADTKAEVRCRIVRLDHSGGSGEFTRWYCSCGESVHCWSWRLKSNYKRHLKLMAIAGLDKVEL
jgi:hypothetical protein